MGLQIRLRHALGERLFDLPDRPLENPLVIGRAKEADVKVPSVTVSGQHGALFVHEGQWYVQDTSSAGSTWVNGNALEGPTPLCVGDTIVLGADANPVTIEVDPAGVAEGRGGEPVVSSEPAPSSARRATVAGAAPPQPARQSASAPTPRPPAVQPPQLFPAAEQDPWGNPGAGDDAIPGWDQPAAPAADSGRTAAARRKKPSNQMSQGALLAGIGICVAIVGGTIAAVIIKNQSVPKPVEAPAAAPVMRYGKSDSIFSEHQEGEIVSPSPGSHSAPTAPPLHAPPPPPPPDSTDSAPPPPPPDSSADAPPKVDDPAWASLDGVAMSADIGRGILTYDDYGKQHPVLYAAELENLINDAMDRLWWKHIAGLCATRDDLSKQLAAKEKDIREQPAGPFQDTLKAEKKDIDSKLAQAQLSLTTDMGYTSDAPPDPENKDQISKLTAERDAGKFAEWKTRTLRYIRTHHGSMPWDGA